MIRIADVFLAVAILTTCLWLFMEGLRPWLRY